MLHFPGYLSSLFLSCPTEEVVHSPRHICYLHGWFPICNELLNSGKSSCPASKLGSSETLNNSLSFETKNKKFSSVLGIML